MVSNHCGSLRGEDEGHNESVERQGLPENQNQNHAHENLVLLCIGTHSRVADDSYRKTCSLCEGVSTKELKPQQSPEARWA